MHGRDAQVCWKALLDKNWLFLILYEKYEMSSCTTGLMRNSDTSMTLAMDLIYSLRLLDFSNKFGSSSLIWPMRVRLQRCCTFIITSVFFLDWHWTIGKSLYWSSQHEYQAIEHWITSWCCFPHRQCLTNSSLFHSLENLNQTKQMPEINNLEWWQFAHHTLYILIYTYIHTYSDT